MINLHEASTKRGIVWGITSIIALVGWWSGRDVMPVITIGMAVASGLGIVLNDK